MKTPDITTIDFETEAIERRPVYPPKPVGVSIKKPGEKKSRYYAWGHPTDNNCTRDIAVRALKEVWKNELAFHNANFDLDVAQTHLGMPAVPWERAHDTLYLLFLQDPHADNLSLKPSAERLLKMKSSERDAVKDWLMKNCPDAKRKPSQWGAYIARAPGGLVGTYADGDVVRTEKLFNKLYPEIVKRSMLDAYNRERRLMPILLENEREGVRIDLPRLEKDYKMYLAAMETADNWLRKKLKAPNLNIDADKEFGDALDRAGIVTEWVYTKPSKSHPQGQRSVSKVNLTPDLFRDAKIASVYGYRNRLQTCLGTFMLPWLEQAQITGGRVHTRWNQVRQNHGAEKQIGARTGRLSSSPNFQNVPKNWKKAMSEGFVHPDFIAALPKLPILRSYFLPDKGDTWGRRDYNQQELRILAHYEDGDLLRQYNEDPRLDIHQQVQDGILEIAGVDLVRDKTKIVNFSDIYGKGLGALAAEIGVDVATCAKIKAAKRAIMPGVDALNDAIKQRGKDGLAIRTWGGREYYCEEPEYVAKFQRVMSFEYKLLNYLIQGSAADCTKESIIRYHHHPKRQGRFLVSVHDETNISAARKVFKEEMQRLREVMQSVEFDVPMLSDGESGKNWGGLTKFKDVA